MNSIAKWKVATAGSLLTAIAGWSTVLIQRPADPAGPSPGIVAKATQAQKLSGAAMAEKPPAAPAVKDARTAALLDSLAECTADAAPGKPSARYVRLMESTLLDNNYERRKRNFSLLMEQLRPEDAPALHKAFVHMHEEGRPFDEYLIFASRWGEVDGEGALSFLRSTGLPLARRDFDEIMKGWGQTNPATALQWLNDHAEFAANYAGEQAVLRGWARQDPDAATQWLTGSNMPSNRLVESVGAVLLEQLYGKGLEATGKWLASLPDDQNFSMAARNGWQMHLHRFNRLGPEETVTFWRTVGNESWVTFNDFQTFIDTAGTYNGRSANENGNPRMDALADPKSGVDITAQFQRWAEANPEGPSAWLNNPEAATPAFRKLAVQGLVDALEKENPEAAAVWRKELNP